MSAATDPEQQRTPEQVRQALDEARLATARSIERLRLGILEEVDWHTHYRRAPAKFLVGALLFGFLVGYRGR